MPPRVKWRAWDLKPEDEDLMRAMGLQWLAQQSDLWQRDGPGLFKNVVWNAVWEFKKLQYWERVWILQELVLPTQRKSHIILCGEIKALFVDITLFFRFLEYLPKASFIPPKLEPITWAAICEGPLFDNFTFSNLSLLKESQHSADPGIILMMAHHTKATNPRDLVYGLLGLLETNIRPDYRKPLKEVYMDWYSLFITNPSEFAILYADHSLPMIQAGIGPHDHVDPSWPTWLPDLSNLVSARTEYIGDIRNPIRQYWSTNMLKGFSIKEPYFSSDGVLSIWGAICTNIFETQQNDDPNSDNSGDLKGLPKLCFEYAFRQDLKSHPTGIPKLQALFRSIYQDWDRSLDSLIPFPLNPTSRLTQWFRLQILKIARDDTQLAMEVVQRAGISNLPQLVVYLDQQFRGDTDQIQTRAWDDALALWASDSSFTQDRVAFFMSWDDNIGEIFYTTEGHVGCGPRGMLPNDQVCVLDKCSLPVILRKIETGWLLVGTCYVYGLSDEEPLGMINSGRLKLEEFKIR